MADRPSNQYAIQFTGPEEFQVNHAKPIDPVGPTQLLLRVEACGICFSDTKLLKQFASHPRKSDVVSGLHADALATIPSYKPNEQTTVPGHEPVVRVVEVGDQVTNFKVGDRLLVQADWNIYQPPPPMLRSVTTSRAPSRNTWCWMSGASSHPTASNTWCTSPKDHPPPPSA